MSEIELPALLNVPPKLLPVITEYKKYNNFLLEGGRSSGKTQFAARFSLYMADTYPNFNVICGRDADVRLEESSHATVKDLIEEYRLPFKVQEKEITHLQNGSALRFRGFNEIAGKSNARGLSKINLLWIDEAQQLGSVAVRDIHNTIIRFEGCKTIITMNRFVRDDPAFSFYYGKADTLHIKINYLENPFNNQRVFDDAEDCRRRNEKEYRHDWLGEPLEAADDYLFNSAKLHDAFNVKPFGELYTRQRVLAVDLAAQGNDLCCAIVLDRMSNEHWQVTERINWSGDNTNHTLGKIVEITGRSKPTLAIVDAGGMGGQQIHSLLTDMGLNFQRFDGGSTSNIDKAHFANARAEGYCILKDWIDEGRIVLHNKDKEIVRQLEKIKFKYQQSGKRIIQPKVDMKSNLGYSPDDADALMMAVWASVKFIGKSAPLSGTSAPQVRRVNNRLRR